MLKRRLIREKVLQILYAFEMNKESLQALIDGILSDIDEQADKDFANDLINRILINKDELDGMMEARIDNWEMSRVALIDKLLLRISICEILYFEDIPPKVSINESIELAKNYSTAGSGKFINGILDSVLNELKKSGRLKKTGRGLLDEAVLKPKKRK